MVVTSVSKTTVFGRIIFVLMLFVIAFGGVYFFQYYNAHKGMRNEPSVTLSSTLNTSDNQPVLSKGGDAITLHANTESFDGIVNWFVPQSYLFAIRDDDTNDLKLSLKKDYLELSEQIIEVEATIPGAKGRNATAKYPIVLQKAAVETGRIEYVASGQLHVEQEDDVNNKYTIEITGRGAANLEYLKVNAPNGFAVTTETVNSTSTTTIKLATTSPATAGKYVFSFMSERANNFDTLYIDVVVFDKKAPATMSFVESTPVLAGRKTSGTVSVKLTDISPVGSTFTWSAAPAGITFSAQPQISTGGIIIFSYESTTAATPGVYSATVSTAIAGVAYSTPVNIVVEQIPTILATVRETSTATSPIGKIQVKNASKTAFVTLSSPVIDATGYPLLISGAVNVASLPESLTSTGWTVVGTGVETTLTTTINWANAGVSSLAAGTHSINIHSVSANDNKFTDYSMELEVLAEKAIAATTSGYLTVGETSLDATITVDLKNGAATSDLKVPVVSGLKFGTWTAVANQNKATITVGLDDTTPAPVGVVKVPVEATVANTFASVETDVTIINIPGVVTPTLVGVTDGTSLQVGSSDKKVTATLSVLNSFDDTDSASVTFKETTAASGSLVLDYVNVSVPSWNASTSDWTSLVTLKETPVSDVVPGLYKIIYNATAIDFSNVEKTISATVEINIADVTTVKSFVVKQTGTITLGGGALTDNQIVVTVEPLNQADLTNIAIDETSVAGSTTVGSILFAFTAWTNELDGSRKTVVTLGTNAKAGSFELTVKDTSTSETLASVSTTLVIAPKKSFTLTASGPLTIGDSSTGITVTATPINGLNLSAIRTALPTTGEPFLTNAGPNAISDWDVTTPTAPTCVLKDLALTKIGTYTFSAMVGVDSIITIDIEVIPPSQISLEQTGTMQIGVTSSAITVTATALYGATFPTSVGFGGTAITTTNLVATPTFTKSVNDSAIGTVSLKFGTSPQAGTYTFFLTDGASTPATISSTINITILPQKALKATISANLRIGSSATANITVTGLNGATITSGSLVNIASVGTNLKFGVFNSSGVSQVSLGEAPTAAAYPITITATSTEVLSTTVTVQIIDEAKVSVASSGTLQIGDADSAVTITATTANYTAVPTWSSAAVTGSGITANNLVVSDFTPLTSNGYAASATITIGTVAKSDYYTLTLTVGGVTTTFGVFVQAAQYFGLTSSGSLQVGESTTQVVTVKGYEGAVCSNLTVGGVPAGLEYTISTITSDTTTRTVTFSLPTTNWALAGDYQITFTISDSIDPIEKTITVLPAADYSVNLVGQMQYGESDPVTLTITSINGFALATNIIKSSITVTKGSSATDLVSDGKFTVSDPVNVGSNIVRFSITPSTTSHPVAGIDYKVTVTPQTAHTTIIHESTFAIAPASYIAIAMNRSTIMVNSTESITLTATGTYAQLSRLSNDDFNGIGYVGFAAFAWSAIAPGQTTRTATISSLTGIDNFAECGDYTVEFKSAINNFAPVAVTFSIIPNPEVVGYITASTFVNAHIGSTEGMYIAANYSLFDTNLDGGGFYTRAPYILSASNNYTEIATGITVDYTHYSDNVEDFMAAIVYVDIVVADDAVPGIYFLTLGCRNAGINGLYIQLTVTA